MQTHHKSYLAGGLTVLFWSTVATAFKLSLQTLDIYQLLFIASASSTLTLFIVIVVSRRLSILVSQFKILAKPSLLMGMMNPVLYYLILFEAYDRLPAQIAQPINYTWAIVLTFLSIIILKQKIGKQDILAALICYAGVMVISVQGEWAFPGVQDFMGIGFAVLSTIIWAGFWILNIKDERDPFIGMFLNFLLSLPLVFIICALFSDFEFAIDVSFFSAIYVGMFEMSLAFLTWSVALKLSVNTSKISNLIFLSPFISLLLIHHILGEKIVETTYVGLFLIVGGLIYQRLGQANVFQHK